MVVNYSIGDFLIRLKNAARAGLKEVSVPNTKIVKSVSVVLEKEGFLDSISQDKKDNILKVTLAMRRKEPVVMDIKLVSKPGLRIYTKIDELAKRKGASILILSTPKGVMSSKQALKSGVGGEVIAEVL